MAKGKDALIRSRLPGINSQDDFIELVRKLQDETGVPVGLKIAASHHLERELAIALQAGVDFVTLDGAEGGTHAGAPILEDDLGLPTMFAINRAAEYFKRQRVFGKVSLIAAGGLITPGQMLKAMALGADCVYIGTAAVMAMVSDQMVGSMPFDPPISMVVYNAKITDKLDVEKGAPSLFRFLNAAVREMELVAYSLSKTSLKDIDKKDLCALDPFLAKATGIEFGYVAPEDQESFFRETEEIWAKPIQQEQPLESPQYRH